MANFEHLENLTLEFFQLHLAACGTSFPTWNREWSWQGSVPFHNKPGVYALLDVTGNVLYIGVAIAKSKDENYADHGISTRLLSHVISADKEKNKVTLGNVKHYRLKQKWQGSGVAHIASIGFSREYDYLALALEHFLIKALQPSENRRK
jgi:LytS/YehU family sensor histidine kinase